MFVAKLTSLNTKYLYHILQSVIIITFNINISRTLKTKKEQPESCSLMLSSEIIVTVLD